MIASAARGGRGTYAPTSSPATLARVRIVVHPRGARVVVDGRALPSDRVIRGRAGRRVHVTATAKGYRRLTRSVLLKGDRVLELRLRQVSSSGARVEPGGDLKANPYK